MDRDHSPGMKGKSRAKPDNPPNIVHSPGKATDQPCEPSKR
jgi:hypothetical protein